MHQLIKPSICMTLLPCLPAKSSSVAAMDLGSCPLPAPLDVSPPPSPRPILTLQGPQATLYVELIQASPLNLEADSDTQSGAPTLLWVRPLLLKQETQQGSRVWHLRLSSDLLWPAAEFAPAYAEEVLPLMEQARDPDSWEPSARQLLQEFLRQVWKRPCQS
ncbi:MAG: hypothetical protein ACUVRV_02390 [Cyanobacteriota bacterium]